MARGVPARLSRGEARRFGLVVGAAFLALGALLWWRGRLPPAKAAGVIGAALLLLGAIAPALLRPVHRVWMGAAMQISKVTTPVILGVAYFLVITPVGMARRLLGGQPLKARLHDGSYWVSRTRESDVRERMERQF